MSSYSEEMHSIYQVGVSTAGLAGNSLGYSSQYMYRGAFSEQIIL